jgi:hypothetical protein
VARLFVAVVVLGLLACGDEDPKPCFGIRVGDRFDVEIVDWYDEEWVGGMPRNAADSCRADVGFAVGDVVRLRVVRQVMHEARTCMGSVVALDNPEEFGFELTGDSTGNTVPIELLLGGPSVAVQGCQAGVLLRVTEGRPTDSLFAISSRGTRPFFTLATRTTSVGECAAIPGGTCGDTFVVNIKRAP